jgi:DNA-directed RNA polymerase specialized sigma24 family protein
VGEYWPYVRERTNEQWLMELQGPEPDAALPDLYDLLVRGLRATIGGYRGGVEANFGDFAQEALIKITGNVDSFRGESHFTTWAQKLAISVALTERMRRRDVSDHDLRGGACDSRQVVVLGQPVPPVAKPVGEAGQLECVAKRLGTIRTRADRRDV